VSQSYAWPKSGLLLLWRTCAYRLLVDVDAPAGALRQDELAILYRWYGQAELVAPRRAVYVNFHYPEVWHDGAECCADCAAQMAVEIMRRDVDLVHVSHRGDFQRLVQSIPDHVDDCNVRGVVIEERLELAPTVQRLA